MSLVDLVSLVAGVALGYAAITSLPGGIFFPPPWVIVVVGVSNLFLWMTMAFSVVAFGRVAAYRRMPRPAEWLAILISVSALANRPEFNVDGWVNEIFATFPGSADRLDFNGWRWIVAGLASSAILATFAILRLGRRALPTWLKTLLLSWIALLALAGPLWAFGFLGDDLVSPRGGFGAGNLAILHREACVLFGYFPTGVFFGVPAVATLLGRLAGQRWAWSEWAAVATSTPFAIAQMMLYQGELIRNSPPWLAGLALLLAWFVAVAFASRIILIKNMPQMRRWIEGPGDQEQSPSSESDSLTSTF